MRTTRSSTVPKSSVDPTRSSVVARPSDSPESSVATCQQQQQTLSRIITRSISKKQRKFRFLPFTDPSLTYKGCSKIREMLRKQHQKVLAHINRDRTGEPKGPIMLSPNHKVTKLTFLKYNNREEKTRALDRLGVVWGDRPPLTHSDFKTLDEEYAWSQKILVPVMKTVALTIKLELPDFVNLLSVNCSVYNAFLYVFPLWQTLNLREVNNVGDRLLSALSLTRYHNVEHIDLASAKGIEDKHLKLLKTKKNVVGSLENLESLNLDCCTNISNRGLQDVLSTCPRLKNFSIGNNLRVTDFFIKSLVKNCKCLTHLNLSGCKNITDKGLLTIINASLGLESLDISRCERVTDVGVIAIAEGYPGLKCLSLSGISGVTNKCLDGLRSNTLTTLHVDI